MGPPASPCRGGATVSLTEAGVEQATALSDGNGRYAFSALQPGTYILEAEHVDYRTGALGLASVNLPPSGSVAQDLELTPRPGSIGGRVTSATTGEALQGVKVMVYEGGNLAGWTSTDASGVYTITGLAPGSYVVSADGSPKGYLPAKGKTELGPAQSRTVDLALTPKAGSLSGTVSDAATAKPLSDMEVVLTYADGSTATARTDASGQYAFSDVTAQVAVTVMARAAPPYYLQKEGYSGTATLMAGGSSTVNLRLHPGPGGISGTARDSQGPVSGAAIRLYDSTGNLVAETATDSNGGYSFSNLPPGEYALTFSKKGYRDGEYSPVVLPGAITELNIVALPLPGSIGGTVKDATTLKTLARAEVSLMDSFGTVLVTIVSDASGGYAFSKLQPGGYQVTARHPDYETGSQGQAALILGPGGAATRGLGLSPRPGSIGGRATSATTGLAIAGVKVMAYDGNGNLAAAVTTDASGVYTITNLAESSYSVTFDRSASGYLLATASTELAPAQARVLNAALAPRAGSLSGTVSDSSTGQALAQVEVGLTYPDGSMATALTNAAGEYFFLNVTAEFSVTVTASASAVYTRTADSAATGTVPAGGSSTAYLRLKPLPGSITGTAAGILGPIAGAVIQLYDAKGNLVAQTSTDSQGSYSFDKVHPGAYTLTFSKGGYLPASYQASVNPGAITTVNMAPVPLAGSIAGVVKNSATLKPISQATVLLVDSSGAVVDSIQTDAVGRYAFSRVTSGLYRVSAVHPDYDVGSKGSGFAELEPEGSATVNLMLASRPGSISGQVVNATTGAAIPGAIVRWTRARTMPRTCLCLPWRAPSAGPSPMPALASL